MRNFLIIGILGAAIIYGTRIIGAKKIGDKSTVRALNPRISRTDGNGIVIRFDVTINNPTNATMRLSKPVITLSSQGKYLVSSTPENKLYTIEPQKQTSLEFIEISIPWLTLSSYLADLISRIPALLKTYQTTGRLSFESLAIPLEYKYSTYVNDLYYESQITKII